uniref:Uncharacterized protein n=1 Tax=viral metagenome TaxID=1070528 RepID=A0A6C0LU11_9ZZZZ
MDKQISSSSKYDKPKSSHNYAMIIKWVIIGILVIGFGGVIKELFTGLSEIEKAIADMLGAGANLANTATNSCATRVDCPVYSTSATCNKDKQCTWGAAYKQNCVYDDDCDGNDTCDTDNGTCKRTIPQSCHNKKKSGPSGWASWSCAFTLYGVITLCTTLVLVIARGLFKWATTKNNKNAENEALLKNIKYEKVIEELAKEIKEIREDIDRKNDVKEEGKTPADRLYNKLLVEKVSKSRALRELKTPNNKDYTNQSKAATDNYKVKVDIAKKESIEKDKLTQEDVDAVERQMDKDYSPKIE